MATDGGIGGWLATAIARLRGRGSGPFVRRYRDYAALQFTRSQTQSRMLVSDPDLLLIDYTRTMLGALLLRPDPRTIGMVGLGGGSQLKFCHRHLPQARIEVVENNAQVIALRREFRIPDDGARLQVLLGDGAEFVRARRARYDLLLVDGYDESGIPAALSTQDFYDDCRDALADAGAYAGNLFCADAAAHLQRLCRSFGEDRVLVLKETKMNNRVVLAWRGDLVAAGVPDAADVARRLPEAARRQLAPVFTRVAAALEKRGGRP